MYKIKINGGKELVVQTQGTEIQINGREQVWDMRKLPDGTFHILAHNRSYIAIVEAIDREQKRMTIRINNNAYQLDIQEPIDQLLQKMGLDLKAEKKAEPIKAPMPGLILKILVQEGQALKKGDPVLILEAMKMENVFKASGDAVVKEIKVAAGQAVEKGMVLIELI